MKDRKISKAGGKTGFFSGKGFYIALGISLVAIGGAAWLGVDSAFQKLENNNQNIDISPTPSKIISADEDWRLPDTEVTAPQSDVDAAATESDIEASTPKAQSFIMPVNGDILNEYSGDKVVKSKTLDEWVMHTGVDIKCEVSTPVKASSGGKVKEIRNDDMWGACVVLEHPNGYETYYYNLKTAVNVKKNQKIALGDVLGAVGETAEIERAEESHLHFAAKKDGEWIDPMSIIARG